MKHGELAEIKKKRLAFGEVTKAEIWEVQY